MVAHNILASGCIDPCDGFIAKMGQTISYFTDMGNDPRGGFSHFFNQYFPGIVIRRDDFSVIGYLTARFDVKTSIG